MSEELLWDEYLRIGKEIEKIEEKYQQQLDEETKTMRERRSELWDQIKGLEPKPACFGCLNCDDKIFNSCLSSRLCVKAARHQQATGVKI